MDTGIIASTSLLLAPAAANSMAVVVLIWLAHRRLFDRPRAYVILQNQHTFH